MVVKSRGEKGFLWGFLFKFNRRKGFLGAYQGLCLVVQESMNRVMPRPIPTLYYHYSERLL